MCFHFENQSIQVNRAVSLVLASKNGKSYIGVFKESSKADASLKLAFGKLKYKGVVKKLSRFLPNNCR